MKFSKEEVLKILEGAKDEQGSIPFGIVKKAIEIIMQEPPELHYPAYYADLLRKADVPDIHVGKCSETPNGSDLISRQAAEDKLKRLVNEFEVIMANIREREEDDSVCGLCEYDGAYIGQSGNWCNECPGSEKADCFALKERYRKEWLDLEA